MPGADKCAFPSNGFLPRLFEAVANSHSLRKIRRSLTRLLPFPTLKSDVTNVVYANWLVPASALAPYLPEGVSLIERDGKVILTVLSYKHGHFGPTMFGSMRRFFPSPLQSNWRVYVDSVNGRDLATPTVYFLSNIFDSALYTLTTRLLSDALPSHMAARFEHGWSGESHRSLIEGGGGSAPSLSLETRRTDATDLQAGFAEWFGDVVNGYQHVCLQDAAICFVDDVGALAVATINLPIAVDDIEPLELVSCLPGAMLTTLGADPSPWCFRVPAVKFAVTGERILS
jgi:Uncharacterized conserved protein (COG2071)